MNPKKTFTLLFLIFLTGCSIFTSCEYRQVTLPKTGQTQCYDQNGDQLSNCYFKWQDGMHQAGIAWPEPRFSLTFCDQSGPCADQSSDCDDDSSTDVILDNLTGLMWTRATDFEDGPTWFPIALTDVRLFNEETILGICGYTDWRLANVNELRSVVHYGYYEETCNDSPCASPADWLNSHDFMVEPEGYWTSTFRNSQISVVDMSDGTLKASSYLHDGHFFWPVRGGITGEPDEDIPANVWVTGETSCYDYEYDNDLDMWNVFEVDCQGTGQDGELQAGVLWAVPRFIPQEDGTVYDVLTDLYWLSDANCGSALEVGGNLTWGQAKDFIEQLRAGQLSQCYDQDHDDWRLPNVIELASLMDFGQDGLQVVDSDFFENIQVGSYWTSSVYGPQLQSNLVIDFQYAIFEQNNRAWGDEARVWPVRSEND